MEDERLRIETFISEEINSGHFPTKESISSKSQIIGLSRAKVRDLVEILISENRLQYVDLPAEEKQGARKHYLVLK